MWPTREAFFARIGHPATIWYIVSFCIRQSLHFRSFSIVCSDCLFWQDVMSGSVSDFKFCSSRSFPWLTFVYSFFPCFSYNLAMRCLFFPFLLHFLFLILPLFFSLKYFTFCCCCLLRSFQFAFIIAYRLYYYIHLFVLILRSCWFPLGRLCDCFWDYTYLFLHFFLVHIICLYLLWSIKLHKLRELSEFDDFPDMTKTPLYYTITLLHYWHWKCCSSSYFVFSV